MTLLVPTHTNRIRAGYKSVLEGIETPNGNKYHKVYPSIPKLVPAPNKVIAWIEYAGFSVQRILASAPPNNSMAHVEWSFIIHSLFWAGEYENMEDQIDDFIPVTLVNLLAYVRANVPPGMELMDQDTVVLNSKPENGIIRWVESRQAKQRYKECTFNMNAKQQVSFQLVYNE